MDIFTERIKSLFNGKKNTSLTPDRTAFDFVRTRKYILRELMISKQANTVLGVYSKVLGEGMFLIGVEETEASMPEPVITFSPYDLSGKLLKKSCLRLDEIEMVIPFNKAYHHPFNQAKTKKKLKTSLFE